MTNLVNGLSEPYFQRALATVVVLGLAGGVAGTHVLLRRLSFYVVALSHATFPALVIATLAGVSAFLGGVLGALMVAIAVVALGRDRMTGHANAVGVVLGGAFAGGVALVSMFPGAVNPANLLVGSLIGVDAEALTATAVAVAVALLGFLVLHKEVIFSAFDQTGAAAAGYRTSLLDLVVMALVGVVVVASIPAVGALMSIALILTPALAGRALDDRLLPAMFSSTVIGILSGVTGLIISTAFDVAAGGAITVVSIVALLLAVGLGRCRR